jgi:pimeloyl-ACP methyl ester carboxylesterase
MTVLTIHEQQEIDRANDSGLQPVVFVHGLWFLSSSWDNWRALFEGRGYTTLAPGWPDAPDTVEEAKHDPEVFAHKRLKQVTDHYVDAIGQLKTKPAVIGHSFGGLIAQKIAGEGVAAVTVAIDPAPFRGVLPLPLSALKSSSAVLGNPLQLHPRRPADLRAVPFRLRQRRRRERSARAVRDALSARLRCARLPGGHRQSQPVDRSPGRHEESRAWTAADHLRRARQHRPVGDCPCLL